MAVFGWIIPVHEEVVFLYSGLCLNCLLVLIRLLELVVRAIHTFSFAGRRLTVASGGRVGSLRLISRDFVLSLLSSDVVWQSVLSNLDRLQVRGLGWHADTLI